MPRVMMISGVGGSAPIAGAYRPPIGRVLNPQTNDLSGGDVRAGLTASLLRGAGVGMYSIPSRTINETIPGASRLPQLGFIPGQNQLPQLRYPAAALMGHGVGFPPAGLMGARGGVGFVPGQQALPMLRGLGAGRRSGLGVDFCNDPGWAMANNLLAVGGNIMSAAAGSGDNRDAGWAAAGGTVTGASEAWRRTCEQQAQLAAQKAAAQGDPTEADTLRQQLALEQARREAEGQAFQQRQLMFQQQAAMQARQSQASNELPPWALPAAGVAVAGIIALAILK